MILLNKHYHQHSKAFYMFSGGDNYYLVRVMAKALGGFIAGFSLAIFLFSLMIYIYATPHLETMESVYQINENVYAVTHSPVFDGGILLLDGIKNVGGLIPVVGQYAGYAGDIKSLLLDVKDLSESIKNTLGFLIMLANSAIYMMFGSFFGFIIGAMIVMRPEQRVVIQQAVAQARYCSECGAQNPIGANHCSQCGKKL